MIFFFSFFFSFFLFHPPKRRPLWECRPGRLDPPPVGTPLCVVEYLKLTISRYSVCCVREAKENQAILQKWLTEQRLSGADFDGLMNDPDITVVQNEIEEVDCHNVCIADL